MSHDGVDLLLDQFPGTRVVTTFRPPPPPTKPAVIKARLAAGRLAPLHVGADVSPTSPARFTVVAPGGPPGARGAMPGGRIFRSLLSRHELWLDDAVWVNHAAWGGVEELDVALAAAGATCVLLVGQEVVKDVLPYQLQHGHGAGFVHRTDQGDYLVMPVYHPGVLETDKGLRAEHDLDVYLFSEMVKTVEEEGGEAATGWLGDRCVWCGEGIGKHGGTGVDGEAYCGEHWDEDEGRGKRKLGEAGQGGVRVTGARKKAVRKGKNTDPNQSSLT